MEARLTLNTTLSDFEKSSGLTLNSPESKKYLSEPKYNISPSDFLPVTTNTKSDELSLFKWGLIPGWTTSTKTTKGLTSISVEAFRNKPVLQNALSGKRCLIWCSGFYLWKESAAGKIPFYITLKTGKIFTIAGFWESWEEETSNTCCLVTHDSKTFLPFFKSEMPVVLLEEKRSLWLNGSNNTLKLLSSTSSLIESNYEYYPVIRKIIKSSENDPKFIQKIPYLVAEQTNMFS